MKKTILVAASIAFLAISFACAKKAAEPPATTYKEPVGGAAPGGAEAEKTVVAAGAPARMETAPGSDIPTPTRDPGALLLIKTADLTVEVSDIDQGFEEIYKIAAAEKAIVTKTGRSVTEEGVASGTVQLKVLPERFDETMAALRKVGRLVNESSSSEDVTARYVDLKARLENAEAARQRYLDILATKSGSVEDILAVEREIERVTENVERLKGEMRLLETQIGLSTINVALEEPHGAVPGGYKFVKAIKAAVRIAVYISIFLIQAVIVLMPFIIILLILILIIRLVVGYFQKKKKKAKAAATV